MRIPSDITICLPCRTIPNPALSRAFTASRWLIPGILGTLNSHTYLTNILAG